MLFCFQVLFCRLTDYQRELYLDYIHSPAVESMLVGRKQVCVCVCRAANIVLLLVLMYLPKILILKYSKIPRSLLNTTTTLIYTQHTLYILSYNKTLLSGRKVHAYLALFLAISSSSLVSSTLLLHSVSLQVLLEVLELCNQVSTHRHPSWDMSAGFCACAAIEELEIWREIRILKRS